MTLTLKDLFSATEIKKQIDWNVDPETQRSEFEISFTLFNQPMTAEGTVYAICGYCPGDHNTPPSSWQGDETVTIESIHNNNGDEMSAKLCLLLEKALN